MSQQDAGSV